MKTLGRLATIQVRTTTTFVLAKCYGLYYILIDNCTHGDIRLVGGTTSMEGRVELCSNGVWGTVHNSLFGTNEAAVVCRMLNFTTLGNLKLLHLLEY